MDREDALAKAATYHSLANSSRAQVANTSNEMTLLDNDVTVITFIINALGPDPFVELNSLESGGTWVGPAHDTFSTKLRAAEQTYQEAAMSLRGMLDNLSTQIDAKAMLLMKQQGQAASNERQSTYWTNLAATLPSRHDAVAS